MLGSLNCYGSYSFVKMMIAHSITKNRLIGILYLHPSPSGAGPGSFAATRGAHVAFKHHELPSFYIPWNK